jgi:hypothetical protein
MNRRTYGSIVALAALSGCAAVPSGSAANEPGETYTTETGVDLTVDRVETQREGSVVLDGDTPLTTKSGASGFLLTHLVATNTTETPVEPPAPEQFRLSGGGEQQRTYQEDFADAPGGAGSRISDPVSGPLFPSTAALEPGAETDGWFVFTLPDGGSATLELLVDGEAVTAWSVPL